MRIAAAAKELHGMKIREEAPFAGSAGGLGVLRLAGVSKRGEKVHRRVPLKPVPGC